MVAAASAIRVQTCSIDKPFLCLLVLVAQVELFSSLELLLRFLFILVADWLRLEGRCSRIEWHIFNRLNSTIFAVYLKHVGFHVQSCFFELIYQLFGN